jgi:hypothetical protein
MSIEIIGMVAALRHLRDILCARVHTPQDDSTLTATGRTALATVTDIL